MRTLRILLIGVAILGVLFVVADRVAVGFVEDEVASRLKTTQRLTSTPDVSIKGFPFLTQIAFGDLTDVKLTVAHYGADTGDGNRPSIRIDDLKAHIKGVRFSSDYNSATATTLTGTATIPYGELLKAAQSKPTHIVAGVTARVVGLSDGGNGKIRAGVEFRTPLGTQIYGVVSSISVTGDEVKIHADNLPKLVNSLAEKQLRSITDFRQRIDQLPSGMKVDRVRASKYGVEIAVRGSNVELAE
ncbi:hypothetical protein QFZ63_000108 [Streptomyces sp. B3I7]|uniref:LmeA family phospholipid-binding protein n=1 Tax=Streptomyces sp. B3I7 TaxID=3042269 RepID=UPI0027858A9A|nr:DUF2993 domain-containing protein [Streptomyces sp. B3I7]MDQ0808394.1 hypothetical protein [Streptomyces sp. B3I7]